jgi:hypothetical protein
MLNAFVACGIFVCRRRHWPQCTHCASLSDVADITFLTRLSGPLFLLHGGCCAASLLLSLCVLRTFGRTGAVAARDTFAMALGLPFAASLGAAATPMIL